MGVFEWELLWLVNVANSHCLTRSLVPVPRAIGAEYRVAVMR
jgi:hypothetical protein